MLQRLAIGAMLLAGTVARADGPVTLRLATVAPDGTAWARELKAFARDVAAQTNGALNVKWYFGGIAGDDVQIAERIKRDQLDGVASGGMLCDRVSPLMRAMHVLTQERDEATWVLNRLNPQISEEFKRAGFVYLGGAGLGPDVLFTREPVRTVSELKHNKLWVWDLDDVMKLQLPEVGVTAVPLPVTEAARAYDDDKVSGFVALPAAALVFQWSAQAKYVTDLRLGFVTGCVLLADRAFDLIPPQHRELFRSSGAKLQMRMQDLGKQQDDQLLGGLFQKQGLKPVSVSETFRAEYDQAAHSAQQKLGDKLVPKAQLDRTLQVLGEYHREHAQPGKKR
jgi:TRAP-type C4-dicarboxylate transport system substrate-binding protein